jgi:hypothetical protein
VSGADKPASAIARLRAKREAAGRAEDRHVDLLVPDSDEVYVRLGYLDNPTVNAITKRVAGKKERANTDLRVNTAVLIEACRGIFVREAGGKLVSIDPDNPSTDPADWLRFDPRLGELLGVEGGGATEVARALFGADWHIMSVARAYGEWLTPVSEELDEAHQGE